MEGQSHTKGRMGERREAVVVGGMKEKRRGREMSDDMMGGRGVGGGRRMTKFS